MTPDERESLIADYLTGEMPQAARAAFEGQMSQDATLAREVAELQGAQAMVAAVALPEAPPGSLIAWPSTRQPLFRFATAAAVLLAFLAGFAAHAWSNPRVTTPAISANGTPTPPPVAPAAPSSQEAVIRALSATPSDSDLARTLIALGSLQDAARQQ